MNFVGLIIHNFNPRSREGSDDASRVIKSDGYTISILAPARGATLTDAVSCVVTEISILASARGATSTAIFLDAVGGFQSSLPRGERQCVRSDPTPYNPISILAPARGATCLFIILEMMK